MTLARGESSNFQVQPHATAPFSTFPPLQPSIEAVTILRSRVEFPPYCCIIFFRFSTARWKLIATMLFQATSALASLQLLQLCGTAIALPTEQQPFQNTVSNSVQTVRAEYAARFESFQPVAN